MKQLIVMRHGEAVSGIGMGDDRNRTLTDYGQAQAKEMGQRLRERGWVPELAIVSDATRTQQTWDCVQQELAATVPSRVDQGLYLSGHKEVSAALTGLTESTVIVVGHNPGWSELATELSGRPQHLSTAATVLLSFSADTWDEAMASVAESFDVMRPA